MASLLHRRNSIAVVSGNKLAPGSSYSVTAFRAGAQVHTSGSATPIRVRKGHGVSANDKFFKWPGAGAVSLASVRTVTSVTVGTTYDDLVYTGSALTVAIGDVLINLGPDSASNGSQPAFDGSPLSIYTYMDGTTAYSNETVTSGSDGEYSYWHRGKYSIWELVRTGSGALADFYEDGFLAESDRTGVFYADAWATGGTGSPADPYTGWESVVSAAAAAGSGTTLTFGYPHARIHFRAGIYETTTSGVFNAGSSGSIVPLGLTVTGDGPLNSVIRHGTLSSDTWFFDNYASNTYSVTWAMCTFQNVGFFGYKSTTGQESGIDYGSLSQYSKGFRLFTNASERDYTFINCKFDGLDECFHWLGGNVASEFNFVRCFFSRIRTRCFYLSNQQAVGTDFSQCHAQIIFGQLFDIGPQHTAGSGNTASAAAIKWYGGSIILQNDAAATLVGTARWMVRQYIATERSIIYSGFEQDTDSNVGVADNPFGIFRDVYMEMGQDDTGLVYAPSITGATLHFVFENCRMRRPSSTTHKEIVQIGVWKSVHFVRCAFYDEDSTNAQMRFRLKGTSNANGLPGAIIFERCQFGADDWTDRCLNDTSGVGRYSAINCWGLVGSQSARVPQDFEINGIFSGYRDGSCRVISQGIVAGNAAWPRFVTGSSSGELTVLLPDNAILKAIHLWFPGSTTNANTISFAVSNNDYSYIYGVTPLARQDAEHRLDIDNIGRALGTGTTDRTVRLYSTGGGSGTYLSTTGGYCTVEYY